MKLVVMKFGGSSVANAEKVRHVAGRVIELGFSRRVRAVTHLDVDAAGKVLDLDFTPKDFLS